MPDGQKSGSMAGGSSVLRFREMPSQTCLQQEGKLRRYEIFRGTGAGCAASGFIPDGRLVGRAWEALHRRLAACVRTRRGAFGHAEKTGSPRSGLGL